MKDVPDSALYSSKIARASGSNFYWSFFFLPRAKRNAIFTVYAFSRLVDDAVDEAASESQARAEIALWRRRLASCYGDGLEDPQIRHPLLPELSETIESFSIPRSYFEDLLTGMEMDLTKTRYETIGELETYCYHVAGTIGLLCNHLFGFREDGAAREYAVLLGRAFQLTNIIRDVGRDARLGRIYLPREEMTRFGVEERDVLAGRSSPAFQRLMDFEADRAAECFARAFAALPKGKRKKILPAEMMAAFYQAILQKTRRENFPVFQKKVSLSPLKKLALAAKTLVGAL